METIRFYLPLAVRWAMGGDFASAWVEIGHIVFELTGARV
jgi:hypothetical protein